MIDLDSICCAIVLAHHLSLANDRPDAVPYVPVVNSSKERVALRGEVVHVLSIYSITLDDLIYIEDVFRWIDASSLPASVFLVDHNEPCLAWHRSALVNIDQINVVGILDHHQDSGKCLLAAPRIVEACASCSSLLIARFNVQHEEVLWWPLVWDSMNFTFRTTGLDLAARDALCSRSGLMDAQKAFSQLEVAANSVPEHSIALPLLLLKDYKLFCAAATFYYGMSTVHVSLDSILPEEGLEEAIKKTLESESLCLLVICSAYRSADVQANPDDYSFQQQVLFACTADASCASITLTEELPMWMSKEGDLHFIRLALGNSSPHRHLKWSAWQQGKAANAGRKQLQPLISRFLSHVSK